MIMLKHQDLAVLITGWKTLARGASSENSYKCVPGNTYKSNMARFLIKVKNKRQSKCPSIVEWIDTLWYISTMDSM